MEEGKVIHQLNNGYRIVELVDIDSDLNDLKGDCFDSKLNPEINPTQLKNEEIAFENKVKNEGVFGYELQKIDPDYIWQHINSCFGFIGQYDEKTNNHYIVEELIENSKKAKENDENEFLKKYAQYSVDVQNAYNLVAVVGTLHEFLRGCIYFEYDNPTRDNHPITILFVDKIMALTKLQYNATKVVYEAVDTINDKWLNKGRE